MTIRQSDMDAIALQSIVHLAGADPQAHSGVPVEMAWRMYAKVIEQRYELATLWLVNLIIPRIQVLGYQLSPAIEELSEQMEQLAIGALNHKVDADAIRAGGLTQDSSELIKMLGSIAIQIMNPLYYPGATVRMHGEILRDLCNQYLLFREFNHVYRTGQPSRVLDRVLNQHAQRGNILGWFQHLQQVLALVESLPSFKEMSAAVLEAARTKVVTSPSLRGLDPTIAISEQQVHIIQDKTGLQARAASPLR